MTVQSTFITTDNVENWYLIEHNDNFECGCIYHMLIAWKLRGIDAPAIPITVGGGPRIITNETVWFLVNSDNNVFYGMDESGCWYKQKITDSSAPTVQQALKMALHSTRKSGSSNHYELQASEKSE